MALSVLLISLLFFWLSTKWSYLLWVLLPLSLWQDLWTGGLIGSFGLLTVGLISLYFFLFRKKTVSENKIKF